MTSEQLINAKLLESRSFSFGVLPGKYFVVAFEDINKDFHYQPGEPAGYYGNPTIIPIEAGAGETAIQVTLTRNLRLVDAETARSRSTKPDDERLPKLWRGRANVGEIKTLDDQRFDQDIGELGMWQPLRFSMELGPGLFMLEPYDAGKTPIPFVHGIGGSPRIRQRPSTASSTTRLRGGSRRSTASIPIMWASCRTTGP